MFKNQIKNELTNSVIRNDECFSYLKRYVIHVSCRSGVELARYEIVIVFMFK